MFTFKFFICVCGSEHYISQLCDPDKLRKTMVAENPKVMFGSNKGSGKEMDESVEILVIICLVQRRGQKGMNFNCIYVRFKLKREGKYFKTKLPFYRYFNTIRVL